jgi:hypothetical protein
MHEDWRCRQTGALRRQPCPNSFASTAGVASKLISTTSTDLPRCELCRKPGELVYGDDADQAEIDALRVRKDGSLRVAKNCPDCGSKEYKKVRPKRWIAFTQDRLCMGCGFRYTPPTPRWAAVVFIIAGLLLAAFGLIGVLAGLARGNPVPLACEGLLGVIGVLAIIHGVRCLAEPGSA